MGLINLKVKDKKKSWHPWRWLTGVVAVLVIAIFAASCYFFSVAMVPGHKNFINNSTKITKSDPLYDQKMWFKRAKKQQWTMQSATDNYRLVADYIPAAHSTTKNVVIAHGFMGNKEKMGEYAALFHQMGYNVLMPDARAHGQSQGKYIGYGWPERYDIRKWTNKLIQHNGKDSQIVIFGVSMGGATTMMTSGIKLPSQVKAFVEDCGYTSLNDELNYEAGNLYHIPKFLRVPLISTMSLINRVQNGFFIRNASSIDMLQHNHRPMLFIHGANDNFVPTKMVYRNYQATNGKKELWVVPGAAHAKSYATHPVQYQRHLANFLNQYIK
ncbi:alpha/beta hydrolase [Limosilactobacillus sp. STM2_1]|uniref:Alpha/beta hydrolase n=1 Tax=Limosilactobacillus rudii TaxID=2759755 RepID=A0A7W3UL06_9LACO|nr:alpha/beta hydrolase [Limosilactobacillus rudii]MBB1079491.1 alpha/beta hydrolase [Limosilactobacillus rudii]MBB1097537.1 alpha/beta hydrolase [Limosilactobacillus rudii]MCD7134647.1 alpha/beta hydrolase [Limosilactobacillus rudii]